MGRVRNGGVHSRRRAGEDDSAPQKVVGGKRASSDVDRPRHQWRVGRDPDDVEARGDEGT